jgi:hypothetical protein
MRKSVKTLSLITILFLLFYHSEAQFKFASQGNKSSEIKKIIEDFPNHFTNIRGEVIVENPQSTEYECNLKAEGTEESSITIYSSKKKTICSWQGLMLTTENFSEAKKKYKELYGQLNNLAVKFESSEVLNLKGDYEEPKEEKRFASSVFILKTEDESIKKLKVEISLQYELMEWKVKLLVYDREREDHERGKIKDD